VIETHEHTGDFKRTVNFMPLQFFATESIPFGLDLTWWTAITVIVAAVLGLWGVVGPIIVRWVWKPKLELVFDRLSDFSEIRDGKRCLRLPVSNWTRHPVANNIEVFLESIRNEHVKKPRPLATYLPVRLLWSHGSKPVCDRIASGAYRLLDIGYLVFTVGPKQLLDPDSARADALVFYTEVGTLELAIGSYVIGFLVTSHSSVKRYRFKLTIRDQAFDPKAKPKRYLKIESA
jgi:hypothetical protein